MTTTSTSAPGAHPTNEQSERSEWYALLARYQAVEATPRNQTTDETFDLAGDLCCKLMEIPAPDKAALVWKLDYILEPQRTGFSSPSWSKDFLAQTILDYHCFLGDAAAPFRKPKVARELTTELMSLGCEIDALMRTIRYLHRAIEDAADDVKTTDECSREAMDRVLVFASLINEVSLKASAMAEQVEALGVAEAKARRA